MSVYQQEVQQMQQQLLNQLQLLQQAVQKMAKSMSSDQITYNNNNEVAGGTHYNLGLILEKQLTILQGESNYIKTTNFNQQGGKEHLKELYDTIVKQSGPINSGNQDGQNIMSLIQVTNQHRYGTSDDEQSKIWYGGVFDKLLILANRVGNFGVELFDGSVTKTTQIIGQEIANHMGLPNANMATIRQRSGLNGGKRGRKNRRFKRKESRKKRKKRKTKRKKRKTRRKR